MLSEKIKNKKIKHENTKNNETAKIFISEIPEKKKCYADISNTRKKKWNRFNRES